MGKVLKLEFEASDFAATAAGKAIEQGVFGSVEEIVRVALEEWASARNLNADLDPDFARELREADHGPFADAETVFARLRAKYVAMAEPLEGRHLTRGGAGD